MYLKKKGKWEFPSCFLNTNRNKISVVWWFLLFIFKITPPRQSLVAQPRVDALSVHISEWRHQNLCIFHGRILVLVTSEFFWKLQVVLFIYEWRSPQINPTGKQAFVFNTFLLDPTQNFIPTLCTVSFAGPTRPEENRQLFGCELHVGWKMGVPFESSPANLTAISSTGAKYSPQ